MWLRSLLPLLFGLWVLDMSNLIQGDVQELHCSALLTGLCAGHCLMLAISHPLFHMTGWEPLKEHVCRVHNTSKAGFIA